MTTPYNDDVELGINLATFSKILHGVWGTCNLSNQKPSPFTQWQPSLDFIPTCVGTIANGWMTRCSHLARHVCCITFSRTKYDTCTHFRLCLIGRKQSISKQKISFLSAAALLVPTFFILCFVCFCVVLTEYIKPPGWIVNLMRITWIKLNSF